MPNTQPINPIYIFSGLGADSSVFQKIDFSPFEPIFIKWVPPLENESIGHYAGRLRSQITTNQPTFIGLSFGGIMAVEVAKQMETRRVILLASAKNKFEVPFYYRWAGALALYHLLPWTLMKSPNRLTNWFFGTTDIYDRKMLKEILGKTDIGFLKWAVTQIMSWKSTTSLPNIKHIPGSADRILPIRYVKCDQIVKGGGHFMPFNRNEEVEVALKKYLIL